MPVNDDMLIYRISCWAKKNILSVIVMRKYKFTHDFSKGLAAAALSIRNHRKAKTDVWKLVAVANPPCFVNLLFSDGIDVVWGKIDEAYDLKVGFDPSNNPAQALLKNPITWWRHMPEGPRDYYRFHADTS